MKTKIIIASCSIIVILLLAVLSLGLTVSAKGYEHFDVTDKLNYDENQVALDMAKEKDICLSKDKKSDYVVVYPYQTSDQVQKHIDYFVDVLNKIMGTSISAVSDNEIFALPDKAFFIGDTKFSKDISRDGIENDGYRVFSDDNKIYILANNQLGCINGLYGFLEDNLEVMFIEENYDYIPKFDTVYLKNLDYISNPDSELRHIVQYEANVNDWGSRLRLNASQTGIMFDTKLESNTLEYIPAEKYMESNPEYFALVDGIRQPTQLCYAEFISNQNAFATLTDEIDKRINNNPLIEYIDISVMKEGDYCECDACEKILSETSSKMGSILMLVNKLAEHYPDYKIVSSVYGDMVIPYKTPLKDNVVLQLVLDNISQNYSIEKAGNSYSRYAKSFVEKWNKYSKNIIVVDNIVSDNVVMPYPNYAVQEANMSFYLQNNSIGVIHKGCEYKEGEMARLRTYLLAKQLWDGDVDIQQLMAKYLSVAYGEASSYVARYITQMSNLTYYLPGNVASSDTITKHKMDYLAITTINEYMALIREAMNKTQDDKIVFERVERIYMSLMYSRAMDSSLNVDKKATSAQEFMRLADKYGVEKVNVRGESLEDWYITFNEKELEGVKTIRIAIITLSAVFPMILIGFGLMVVTTGHKKKIIIQTSQDDVQEEEQKEE